LATHFTSTPEIRISENIPVLEHTISTVMAAIEKTVTDHHDSDNETVAAFNEAADQLRSSFDALKLGRDQFEIDLDEASTTDQGVNERYDESKQPAPPQETDSVTVTVKVDNADKSFTVGKDTTLRTISYQLAIQHPIDKRDGLLRCYFTEADGTTVVPNEQKVAALSKSDVPGGLDSLRLNFGDPVPSSSNPCDEEEDSDSDSDSDYDSDEDDEDEDEDEEGRKDGKDQKDEGYEE